MTPVSGSTVQSLSRRPEVPFGSELALEGRDPIQNLEPARFRCIQVEDEERTKNFPSLLCLPWGRSLWRKSRDTLLVFAVAIEGHFSHLPGSQSTT
jgi:hypothetical protein